MNRLLLFDVDGTLVDVDGAGRAALGSALEQVYGEAGPVADHDFHGRTDPSIVRGLLRAAGHGDGRIEAGLAALWPVYLERLETELEARADRVRPHAGVPGLLARLAEDPRFTLGLVTGNVREGAFRKLQACGVRTPFRFGAFGSDSERREDLPPLAVRRARSHTGRRFRPGEVWVIGDTPEDVRCGRLAGHRTLAVATGRYDVEELRRHGADEVAGGLGDHELLLRRLAA